MKICMLSTTFPRFHGDMYANFIYFIAKKFVERGMTVKVVCSHHKRIKREEKWDGIEIFRYRYMIPETYQQLTYEGGILAAILKNHWNKILIPFFMLSFLLKGLKVGKSCDVIHAHWTISGLIALLVGKWYKKPVVLTVHGSDINVLNKKFLLKLLNGFILSHMDCVIAVSPVLEETLRKMGVMQERLRYIPNGVDIEEFYPVSTDYPVTNRILWVGRMSKEKGLDILIKAMREVVQDVPQAQLILVGDGPERGAVEQMIKDYHLGEHIHLEGLQSHLEMPRYFRMSQIFVLPSAYEGFPLVVLEALASGLPCIASNVGGIQAVIENGVNGYLVPPKDASELSFKIIELMSNPEVVKEMGKNAREKVKDHYSWDKIADRTIDFYQHAMVCRNGKLE